MIKELIKNDIRYLRGWLLLWGGILGAMLLSFVLLRTDLGWSADYWGFLRIALLLGFLLQVLFQLLLVAKIVQKESLHNLRAYWLTRPISRRCLPLAKGGTLLIVVLLPQLLQAALMGACFPGGWAGAWAGLQAIAVLSLVLCFFGMLCASMTKDTGPALLALIFLPFALMILGGALMWIPGLGALLTDGFFRVAAFPYAGVVLGVVALALGLWSFARQYRSPGGRWPHRIRCLASFALLVMASAAVPLRTVPESTITPPADAALKVTGDFRFIRMDRPFPGARSQQSGRELQTWLDGGPGSSYGLKGEVAWSGLPDDWLVVIRALRTYAPSGQLLPPGDERSGTRYRHQLPDGFKAVLFPDDPRSRRTTRTHDLRPLFFSPLLDVGALQLPETFTTVFATQFYRGETVRLPFGRDARIQVGNTRLLLLSAERPGGYLSLRFLFIGSGEGGRSIGERVEGGYLVLRDPQTGRAVFGQRRTGSSSYILDLLSTGEFEMEFKGLPPFEDLSDLEFYYVRTEPLGVDVRAVDYAVSEKRVASTTDTAP